METLYLLIPLSVVLVFAIGAAFWWSLRGGQFDDLEGPAYRILMDDDSPPGVAGRSEVPVDSSPSPPAEPSGGDGRRSE
ncbi:cbb3-type cytochrome oxidase assembly protein CcoS [Accumulibacter sp.]|uniref:cbb3-type cytochrome oxidase assembly protein CcoS n=1 Tax=Accumulibacter sp. TaxID=2053492 RepID=UPI0025ED19FF|nr:cbb3-type cytochrome oxidase assembly protein CcoS [Accumulibacter sp.]MCM8596635.1 cbb3-type cytochrome oxidase assembly protein CcoS [Accumulibacter sp.]MCM8627554.1 cbb3-type cytochrome oxidase assembly protein CcoS [Accumulibacter sp.]MDS4050783.1 cbb3-type cytochrome oxidase assembly protein CcoS [Accumulibacter sp.]